MRMSFLALVLFVAVPASAVEVGLSGPSVFGGNVEGALAAARAIEGTGTAWVRVNFRLDVWSAPDDATARGPQLLTWFAAYDRLVDELTTHGVQVYGEIGAESVPGGGEPDSDDFVQRYAAAFVQIADHFRDRVRVFETFNEPNNWRDAVSMRPAVSPYYLAKMQQEIYLNTKFNNGRGADPCAQVVIVSGALFSSEDTNAADYLAQVYAAGRDQLAWDWMHEHVGSYPLDGIGYHIYVGQGGGATPASVQAATRANLDGVWAAVAARDDGAAAKRIWLTEFGWTIDQVSAAQQAQLLTAAYAAYDADPRVAAAFWFTYQDFPGGRYGLFDDGGLDQSHRRPAYAAFTAAAADYRPPLSATFTADDVPASMAPGETRTITITARNLGRATWREADLHRLGAAPGCPSAAAANTFAFTPAAPGYATSPVDARVALGASVAPGSDTTFQVAVTAPNRDGDHVLAVRMVQDGVAWFGDTLRRTVHVSDAGATGGDGPAGNSAGGGAGDDGSRNAASGNRSGCSMSAAGAAHDRRDRGEPGPVAPLVLLVSVLAIFLIQKKRLSDAHLHGVSVPLRWSPAPQGKPAPSSASLPGSNHPV
ncbi:MAG: hypothetical protein JWN44_728 [Myxococcales bacterium]|nr:hypothetical protein [Myxococcales bacterium]